MTKQNASVATSTSTSSTAMSMAAASSSKTTGSSSSTLSVAATNAAKNTNTTTTNNTKTSNKSSNKNNKNTTASTGTTASNAHAVSSTTSTTTTITTTTPASLNLYQKVAIVRHASDTLQYEDAHTGTWKKVSVHELGDALFRTATVTAAPSSTKEQGQQLQQQQQQQPSIVKKQDIPVPRICSVSNYHKDIPANYQLPNSYVRFHKATLEEWQNRLDYVADKEDEQFWQSKLSKEWNMNNNNNNNTTTTNDKLSLITLDLFERMMDILEKATGFDAIVTFHHAETLLLNKLPQLYHLFPGKRSKQQQQQVSGSSQQSSPQSSTTLKQVLNDVYQYWVQKRSKLKRPLLRKFWPVTSTDDTNPHLVFRPREKEKYKLRKKRQNDMDAYLKLKQLRSDFDHLRAILELVKRREQLSRLQLQCHVQLFQQRMIDLTDTSMVQYKQQHHHHHHLRGASPVTTTITTKDRTEDSSVDDDVLASSSLQLLNVPLHFDLVGRKAKRLRPDGSGGAATTSAGDAALRNQLMARGGMAHADGTVVNPVSSSTSSSPSIMMMMSGNHPMTAAANANINTTRAAHANIAGRNFGEPAPHFLHPLATRESYATSWEGAVPHVPTFTQAHADPTFVFRHRPRVGRGGRICIDRLPIISSSSDSQIPPHQRNHHRQVFYTAGRPLPVYPPKERLLDLLPRPLPNYKAISQRIQEIVLSSETDLTAPGAGVGGGISSSAATAADSEENDGDAVLVKVDDWLETDDPLWGEERFSIGPV